MQMMRVNDFRKDENLEIDNKWKRNISLGRPWLKVLAISG